ncbi:Methyltransferase domain-containing protein [Daejeonella rubra]|uniref:Methyltransferase domain-containing protein n=1 Tax=Daejeonella rubra TaxID=990371 RepID=A0A1G9U0Y7_9SPHI|nr:class I SAM-dependent methyltransferase [Daejeonella rubra]SDM53710.1 Methyltransferase domain-containing protein [Daejeonella rubra]
MINLQTGLDYLKYRLKAKTRHGVHSPFAYRLVDKVIYDFHAKKVYSDIEKLRSELLLDPRRINITDLGAGSLVNNNKQKKVSTLARNALKPARLAQLIHRLAADVKPKNIIELGTCLGITTAYLAKAAPNARVISIEGCPETAAIALENLKKLHITNTELLVGNFDEILPKVIRDIPVLDLVFIDGNHRKEATLDYFKWCLPKLGENSLMIFDDIYWSEGMKEAWTQIKEHPEVSVTIDLFHIGLVFVKKGQAKEDFIIRF